MSYYELGAGQSGLGQIPQAIAAFLGPLVEGGASVYAVHQQSKQAREEMRERRKELEIQKKLIEQQIAAQERAHALAQRAAIQQAQIAKAWTGRTAPYLFGAAVIGVLGLVALGAMRPKKRKKKRKKR